MIQRTRVRKPLQMLRLLRDNDLLPLCLGFALARARVLATALLLDARCIEHRALELPCFVHGLREMPCPER